MLSADLKTRTRAHHDAAEASPAMQAVLADDLTRSAYRDHLSRLLAFYVPAEVALAETEGLADALPDVADRLVKSAWLREDLADLGLGAAASSASTFEFGVAEALGALYVIEGSTLGGRIIARHLEGAVGVTDQCGARFYHSYGADRGPRWTAFKEAIDAFGSAYPDRCDAVVQAASDTFDALRVQMAAPLEV